MQNETHNNKPCVLDLVQVLRAIDSRGMTTSDLMERFNTPSWWQTNRELRSLILLGYIRGGGVGRHWNITQWGRHFLRPREEPRPAVPRYEETAVLPRASIWRNPRPERLPRPPQFRTRTNSASTGAVGSNR